MDESHKNSTQKKREKLFQIENDFEKDPARCGNCRNRVIRRFFVKGTGMVNGKPRCVLGGFNVKDYSICNLWKSFQGESLE